MKIFWREMAPVLRRWHGKSFGSFAFTGSDVATDIREKYGYQGEMLQHFSENKGYRVHKWHHYIPLYDRYFSRYKGRQVRFLEIGVSDGGSLQVWRKYFGPQAIIFGIDIDPRCASLDGKSAQVRIGSQDDKAFLEQVVKEMGGVDVVLDDGSHQMPHVKASLLALFPKLAGDGIYVIEDMHTAYWQDFGGGFMFGNNFFKLLTQIIHDVHHWYHFRKPVHASIASQCSGIHVHDSFVVLEKGAVHAPVHSLIGDMAPT